MSANTFDQFITKELLASDPSFYPQGSLPMLPNSALGDMTGISPRGGDNRLTLPAKTGEHDYILLTEFSEQRGPTVLWTVTRTATRELPIDVALDPFLEKVAAATMAVDFRAGFSALDTFKEDTSFIQSIPPMKMSFFAQHFSLLDINARGFVRPLAFVYLTCSDPPISEMLEKPLPREPGAFGMPNPSAYENVEISEQVATLSSSSLASFPEAMGSQNIFTHDSTHVIKEETPEISQETTGESNILIRYKEMSQVFGEITKLLKKYNRAITSLDLVHRLADLDYTRELLASGDEERIRAAFPNGAPKFDLESLDMQIKETRKFSDDLRIMEEFQTPDLPKELLDLLDDQNFSVPQSLQASVRVDHNYKPQILTCLQKGNYDATLRLVSLLCGKVPSNVAKIMLRRALYRFSRSVALNYLENLENEDNSYYGLYHAHLDYRPINQKKKEDDNPDNKMQAMFLQVGNAVKFNFAIRLPEKLWPEGPRPICMKRQEAEKTPAKVEPAAPQEVPAVLTVPEAPRSPDANYTSLDDDTLVPQISKEGMESPQSFSPVISHVDSGGFHNDDSLSPSLREIENEVVSKGFTLPLAEMISRNEFISLGTPGTISYSVDRRKGILSPANAWKSPILEMTLRDMLLQYTFSENLIFSLLIGRPVIVVDDKENQAIVEHFISLLSVFVPNIFHETGVFMWRENSLKISNLPGISLVGTHFRALPANIDRFATLFCPSRSALTSPVYPANGMFIKNIVSMNKQWLDEASFVSHVHDVIAEITLKGFLYYHLCCTCIAGLAEQKTTKAKPPSSRGRSASVTQSPQTQTNMEKLKSAFMKTSSTVPHYTFETPSMQMRVKNSSEFFKEMDIAEGDTLIVEHFAQIVKYQQSQMCGMVDTAARPLFNTRLPVSQMRCKNVFDGILEKSSGVPTTPKKGGL